VGHATDVLASRGANETVLLNLTSEKYFGLDGVGARAWELLEGGTSFGVLVDALAGEYDVDRDTLVIDLSSILWKLQEHGLVVLGAS
jgi:hypothetical protein